MRKIARTLMVLLAESAVIMAGATVLWILASLAVRGSVNW